MCNENKLLILLSIEKQQLFYLQFFQYCYQIKEKHVFNTMMMIQTMLCLENEISCKFETPCISYHSISTFVATL